MQIESLKTGEKNAKEISRTGSLEDVEQNISVPKTRKTTAFPEKPSRREANAAHNG